MARMRFGLVFLLLVLILLAISALFGLLTYWLDDRIAPTPTPGPGSVSAWNGTLEEPAGQSNPGRAATRSGLTGQ